MIMPRASLRSEIDDRVHALVVMEAGCGDLPGYTLGEVMYSALRRAARDNGGDVRFLRRMATSDLLRYIDEGLSNEIDENGARRTGQEE